MSEHLRRFVAVFAVFAVVLGSCTFYVLRSEKVKAADDDDIITVNLDVNSTISIVCTDTVTMNTITGTGQSTMDNSNRATCTVKTNNSGGYKLEWQASAEPMTSGSNEIAAYTPTTPDTPENWSISSSDSEWGAHLGASSTTVDTGVWGSSDSYAAGKWLNVYTEVFQIASRVSETSSSGDEEYVFFGAEVGSNKWQPDGTYTVNVTMTATTL